MGIYCGGLVQFTVPEPLTKFGRVSRALIIVALLLGSLFPTMGGVSAVSVAAALAVPVVLYEVLRFLPKLHPAPGFVLLLVGVLAFHALYVAPTSEYGIEKFSKLVTITLLSALAASLLRDRAAVVTFCRVWVLTALVLAVMALGGYSGEGRAGVFDSNPIWLGRALATGAIMVLWLWWRKHNGRLLMLAAFGVLLAGVMATGSRGPLIGIIVGALILALFGEGRKVKPIVAILGLGGAAWFALETLPIFANNRLMAVLRGDDLSSGIRNIFWDVTLPLIAERPGGVGFGNWEHYTVLPRQYSWPHNMFLEVFAELGVWVGLFFVAAVVFVYVRLIYRARTSSVALVVLALLAAETFAVCVSGDLNGRTFFFLLALGHLAGTKHIDAVVPAEVPVKRPAVTVRS